MKNFFKKHIALILSFIMLCSAGNCVNVSADGEEVAGNTAVSSTVPAGDGFQKQLENEGYALYLNSSTGSVALLDKSTGNFSYSNPLNADSDSIAAGSNAALIKSQLVVYYYDGTGTETFSDSFTQCIEQGNMTASVSGDVLTVNYGIGDDSFQTGLLPRVLSKERMEKDILPKLEDSEQEKVLKYYLYYDVAEMDKESVDAIAINFPSIKDGSIYIRKTIPAYIAEGIYDLFLKTGYTVEDLERDSRENGVESEYEEKPFFKISLNYTLCSDGFNVSFEPEKIEYSENYVPVRIDLLPFFGAANTDEAGYIFVPDGSGSIINFNNGKTTADAYWKALFGLDGAVQLNQKTGEEALSVLPVFALSSAKRGFLATVDSGYEVAGVGASTSGKTTEYNQVYPFFNIISVDSVSLSSQSADRFLMYSKPLSDTVSVTYHMLSGFKTYSELALMYREQLLEQGILPDKANNDITELNIDFIGSTVVNKKFLGIPYKSTVSLTSFEQAGEILGELGDVTTSIRFSNALKGGYMQKEAGKFRFVSVMGTKKKLAELSEKTENLSVSLYAQRATGIKNADAVKGMNRTEAYLYKYNTVSRYRQSGDTYKILSSAKLNSYLTKLIKSLEKYSISAVNLLDLGYELNSDFNTDKMTDRHTARLNSQKYMQRLSEKAELSVEVGSIFALPYADKIYGMPFGDSGYAVEDYSVPFYQIAVSGIIPYTLGSLNTSYTADEAFLRTVEYGAQLQYTWIYEERSNTVRSAEDYYGMLYSDTLDNAKANVEKYRGLYKKIAACGITEHTVINSNVRKTVWENGTAVYVNYGETEYTAEGITVPAMDFYVAEQGGL